MSCGVAACLNQGMEPTYRIDLKYDHDAAVLLWDAFIVRLSDNWPVAHVSGEYQETALAKAQAWIAREHDSQHLNRSVYANDDGTLAVTGDPRD